MHQSSGRWRLGFSLAMLTCLFWATLPVALKVSLEVLDVMTLTWFRFLIAALFTLALLSYRGKLAEFALLRGKHGLLLLVAAAGLTGNYVLYLQGLRYTTPSNAQLLIQSAPLLLAIGGIVWFKESVSALQLAGFIAIGFGLSAFFLDQEQRAIALNYRLGAFLIVLGAASWAVYALLQKQLLLRLGSQHIMCIIYAVAAIVLLPFAQPEKLLADLDRTHMLAIGYCVINTIGAYGAFAEALEHWEASRVSAVLALTPILTLITVALLAPIFPAYLQPERIGTWGFIGAFAVVLGSIAASLGKKIPSARAT
jgi:drug/metabolite transporter (DMT)-like permease